MENVYDLMQSICGAALAPVATSGYLVDAFREDNPFHPMSRDMSFSLITGQTRATFLTGELPESRLAHLMTGGKMKPPRPTPETARPSAMVRRCSKYSLTMTTAGM